MSDALEDHKGSVSIGGRMFINLRFTDDIVVNAECYSSSDKADDILTVWIQPVHGTRWRLGLTIMTNSPMAFKGRSR